MIGRAVLLDGGLGVAELPPQPGLLVNGVVQRALAGLVLQLAVALLGLPDLYIRLGDRLFQICGVADQLGLCLVIRLQAGLQLVQAFVKRPAAPGNAFQRWAHPVVQCHDNAHFFRHILTSC